MPEHINYSLLSSTKKHIDLVHLYCSPCRRMPLHHYAHPPRIRGVKRMVLGLKLPAAKLCHSFTCQMHLLQALYLYFGTRAARCHVIQPGCLFKVLLALELCCFSSAAPPLPLMFSSVWSCSLFVLRSSVLGISCIPNSHPSPTFYNKP